MHKRTALVTGAAQGIGLEIANILLEEGGYMLVLLDRQREKGQQARDALARRYGGQRVRFMAADLAREEELLRVVSQLKENPEGLSLLVNNAAVHDNTPAAHISLAEWNHVLAVNLTAPFLLSRLCFPLLRSSRGSIINICSTRAFASEPDTEAYSASKGGLLTLTHALAMSFGPEVRVNAVSPGWINSAGEPLSLEDNRQHPAGRVGVPRDVAQMVLYLASDKSGFITGQNFTVDGGMTRKMIYRD